MLLLCLTVIIYNRERFRNFIRTNKPEIESRSNKHSFKRISNALGSLANIKSYKYVVGGNRGGSWQTMGFKEDEILAKQLCADITNTFVSELDELNKKMNVERASFHREFIEKRYLHNINELHTAEDKLKEFQETNNLVSINDQTEAVIESASIIKRKIILDQIQLEIYKDAFNPEHSKLEQLKKEIEEFKFKLNELENGSINELPDDKLFLTISDIPDLGLTHLRLQRELEIQTELFKFLTMEYEEAKIEEAKDIPTVQVLDIAKVPERKSKPRRVLLVISILLVCFIGNSLVIITYVNYQFNH